MKIKFEWEEIAKHTFRAKVVGGWVFNVSIPGNDEVVLFISDPNHEWEIDNE